jgi:murein DD-endopeptidase MepM/ murein hydrolase activator NlpD
MKLPQAFSIRGHKLLEWAKGLPLNSKRVLILSVVAILCFVTILPFLNKPKLNSQQASTLPVQPETRLNQEMQLTEQPTVKPSVSSPTPKITIKDLAAPLQGKQIRGTSKDVIWWNVFADYRQHTGVDLQAKEGSKVLATGPGKVIELGTDPAYGKVIVVDHGDGIETVYGQLEGVKVKINDKVKTGQVLAQVGKAVGGEADLEPHLHYEVWQNHSLKNGR